MSVRPVEHDAFSSRLLRAVVAVVAALGIAGTSVVEAAGLSTRVHFDESDLSVSRRSDEARVEMNGMLRVGGMNGTPELPMDVRMFHVPDGYEVSQVRVTAIDETRIAEGVRLSLREAVVDSDRLETARRPYPAEVLDPASATFPARSGASLGYGTMAGYRIHSVAIFPVRWDRGTGDLFLARAMDVELELVPARTAPELVRERVSIEAQRAALEALNALVENPAPMPIAAAMSRSAPEGGFAPRGLPSAEGSAVDMVIVTTAEMQSEFQILADWKTKKGVPTVVRTVDWIDANYPAGLDRPERVRMFLQDAYSKWGTYMLLVGGDFGKVAPRLAYNRFFFGGTSIPTDQYFACLEGTWNADGDALFGEGLFQAANDDQVDLYPDIYVGRASVDTPAEAQIFVNKSMGYEKNPPAGYTKNVCYLAEVLFPSKWVYGDPPDSITLDGSTLTDAFDVLVPPSWTRKKCYQVTNTLNREHALDELSLGRHHLMTLMNHGDAFKFSVGNGFNPQIFKADTDTLSNGDYLMFVMATACNPNQIDLECQGESLMNNANGGAICVLGPTREDFPLSASAYHREMLDLIFRRGVTRYGVMSQVHRIPFVALSQTDATPDRWTMLTKELLGDPEIRFWTEEPADLVVTHPANLALDAGSVTVTVTDGLLAPVFDAVVCVSDANGTYARGRTDAAGQVTLAIKSTQIGTVDVVATAKEFKPSETSVTLDAVAGALVALEGIVVDDDAVGTSSGNGDGVIDAGETIELDVTARNGGGTQADGVTVTASIEAGTSATFDLWYDGVQDPAMVFIGPDGTNPGAVPFTLDFAAPAIEYIGTPNMSFGSDSLSLGDEGIFLWQDLGGWHLRWSSGADSVSVSGTISTDGRVRGFTTLELEQAVDTATLSAGEDSLSFIGTTTEFDLVDGLDFALADNTMLTVTGSPANLGNIAAAATASGKVAFTVSSAARARQIAYVDLAFTSTTRTTWSAETAITVAGPELEAYQFTVDDTTNPPVSGNGNGVVEVGETVRLTPTVLNRGDGYAGIVAGAASASSGITFIDAADAYGDLAALGQSGGVDGYVFTVDDSTGVTIDLVLTDAVGRTWNKNIDFVAPGIPANVSFTSSPATITPAWDPNADADIAGYNVYRSATPGFGHVALNFELIRTASRFEDSGLALGSQFYYYVTAVDSSGNESAASSEIFGYTTQPQVPGWPRSANQNVFGSIAIGNANGTGTNELFVGSQDFKMYGWDAGGTLLPDYPIPALSQIWSTPALADLDGNGDLEILYGANDSRFYVINDDGSPHFGTETFLLDLEGGGHSMRGSPSVADVDHDSMLEFFFATDNGRVYAFNHDGTGLIDSTGLFYGQLGVGNTFGPLIWGTIAIADWDNDGLREIAFAARNDSLYVTKPDGSDAPGFPKDHNSPHFSGPVFADLDNDGTSEIIVGAENGNLYVYNHDGTGYLAGDPVFATLPDAIRAMPSPCNLDGDPELELVVTCMSGDIYAFNHDGTGFLQAGGLFAFIETTSPELDAISTSAIIVDVDGDSDFEIFVGHRNHNFYGFHHDGSTIIGMPIPTSKGIYSTAAAGDLDGDGDVDVAFASYDQFVNVLDFSGPSTPEAYEWATYAGDNFRRAAYGERGPYQTGLDPGLVTVVRFSLAQNRPNPFALGTSIQYAVPKDMNVSLRIYNIEGRLVRTLVNGRVAAGVRNVSWDGRDATGQRLASGVYFYRLQTPEDSATRKSLLLR